MTTYRVSPAFLCHAPAKTFPDALAALRHAREAADAFRCGYAVWRVQSGRLLLVWTFPPPDRRA